MLGMGKIIISTESSGGGGGGGDALDLFVTPDSVSTATTNGTWTSPNITANPSGGTGPYTYSWTSNSADVTVLSPTAKKTKVTSSGYNEIKGAGITCKVTDAALSTKTATATAVIRFGKINV